VGRGDRELVIRPADRGLGKFGITLFRPAEGAPNFRASFFSRRRNIWSADESFRIESDPAVVFGWMRDLIAIESTA